MNDNQPNGLRAFRTSVAWVSCSSHSLRAESTEYRWPWIETLLWWSRTKSWPSPNWSWPIEWVIKQCQRLWKWIANDLQPLPNRRDAVVLGLITIGIVIAGCRIQFKLYKMLRKQKQNMITRVLRASQYVAMFYPLVLCQVSFWSERIVSNFKLVGLSCRWLWTTFTTHWVRSWAPSFASLSSTPWTPLSGLNAWNGCDQLITINIVQLSEVSFIINPWPWHFYAFYASAMTKLSVL